MDDPQFTELLKLIFKIFEYLLLLAFFLFGLKHAFLFISSILGL